MEVIHLVTCIGVITNVMIQGYWLWWSKRIHEDVKHPEDSFNQTQSTGSLPADFIPEHMRF